MCIRDSLGAALISALKFWLTGFAPELWPFILAFIVLVVVTTLPNGLNDLQLLPQSRRSHKKELTKGRF